MNENIKEIRPLQKTCSDCRFHKKEGDRIICYHDNIYRGDVTNCNIGADICMRFMALEVQCPLI